MRRFVKTKRGLAVLAGVVSMLIAGAAYAYFTYGTTGTGTGTAHAGATAALQVVGEDASGPMLMPTPLGDPPIQTVGFTVTNMSTGQVMLGTVTAHIGTLPAGCTAQDYSINGAAVGTTVTLTPNHLLLAHGDSLGGDSYSSSVTVQLVEDNTNQDACQNATVPVVFTANPA